MPHSIQSSQSNKRKIIILLVILLLLIIIAAVYIYLNYFQTEPVSPPVLNQNINESAVFEAVPLAEFNQTTPEVLADVLPSNGSVGVEEETDDAVFISSSFVERFGSYSNQSNYKNFDELDYFMTDSMKNWIPRYKSQLREDNPDINTYYALVTNTISTNINSLDEGAGTAEVLVKTQRQEFNGSVNNPNVYNQDIRLDLLKVNDEWKVNGAYWQ